MLSLYLDLLDAPLSGTAVVDSFFDSVELTIAEIEVAVVVVVVVNSLSIPVTGNRYLPRGTTSMFVRALRMTIRAASSAVRKLSTLTGE